MPPEQEQLSSLLNAYEEGTVNREQFIQIAKKWVEDEKTLETLLGLLDEKRITKDQFLTWAMPVAPPALPAVAPLDPEVDFISAFDALTRTTLWDSYSIDSRRGYKSFVLPFLEFLVSKGINRASGVTELLFDEFLKQREAVRTDKPGEPYTVGTVGHYCRDTKRFFSWLQKRARLTTVHPLQFMECPVSAGEPEIFEIEVKDGVLVWSEVNDIYNTLYKHPSAVRDWRRFEIELRILRETGLRPIHAMRLQWDDIDLKRRIIWYDRISRFVKKKKGLPHIPEVKTPISNLLSSQVKMYIEKTGIDTGSKIYPETDTTGLGGKIRKFRERVRLTPLKAGVLFHAYMFRDSYATFIVCILKQEMMWEAYCGDDSGTLKRHYAKKRMVVEYEDMGLNSYEDVVNIVFEHEGVLTPEKRPVGRPRKEEMFVLP